jgi:hypothetical protein
LTVGWSSTHVRLNVSVNTTSVQAENVDQQVCVCVCALSHWVHAAMVEVPDLPSLKCSSHWSLGLFPASVVDQQVLSARVTCTHASG